MDHNAEVTGYNVLFIPATIVDKMFTLVAYTYIFVGVTLRIGLGAFNELSLGLAIVIIQ